MRKRRKKFYAMTCFYAPAVVGLDKIFLCTTFGKVSDEEIKSLDSAGVVPQWIEAFCFLVVVELEYTWLNRLNDAFERAYEHVKGTSAVQVEDYQPCRFESGHPDIEKGFATIVQPLD